VKKYDLSEEEYDKRDNTYRFAFMQLESGRTKRKCSPRTQIGNLCMQSKLKQVPEVVRQVEEKDEDPAKTKTRIKVGMRCQANPGSRRGEVMYVGPVPELPSRRRDERKQKDGKDVEEKTEELWVGVKFDEPVGKGDGTVKGKSYFKANPKYAGFLNPMHVEVGDFPEKDALDEDVDEEL